MGKIEPLAGIGRMGLVLHDRRESAVQDPESLDFDETGLDFSDPGLGRHVGVRIFFDHPEDFAVGPGGIVVATGPFQQARQIEDALADMLAVQTGHLAIGIHGFTVPPHRYSRNPRVK